jgi:CBS domain containing-hemolysin-like protein
MLSIAIFIGCLISAAFFAATEVAFFSLSALNVTRGNRARLEKLFLHKNDIIAMLLTGNNLAIVGGTLALDSLLPPEREWQWEASRISCRTCFVFSAVRGTAESCWPAQKPALA